MVLVVRLSVSNSIRQKAAELRFDLVGFATVEPTKHGDYFRRWLGDGKAGTMRYLSDRIDERMDPRAYFPAARSAVCVAVNYYVPLEPTTEAGKIARYALGDDYHGWFKQRLFDLADWIRDTYPGAATRCGVDTVPVMEKELAVRGGIGWMGKNTCVIHPKLGSWILLGEVLTSLDLPADESVADHCGSCSRCIDACPTDALTPYQLDATKCISYLTIEHRGDVDPSLSDKISPWLFGCDICQDVCPFNRKPTASNHPDVRPHFPTGTLAVDADWTADDYRRVVKGTAIKRIKLPQLKVNAARLGEHTRPRRAEDGSQTK